MGNCLAPCDAPNKGSKDEVIASPRWGKPGEAEEAVQEQKLDEAAKSATETAPEEATSPSPESPTAAALPGNEHTSQLSLASMAGSEDAVRDPGSQPASVASAAGSQQGGCVGPDGSVILARSLPCKKVVPPPADKKTAERRPSWSPSLGSEFKVRCGPDYAKKKQKAASAESMYECIAVDVLKSDGVINHVARFLDWEASLGSPTPVCEAPGTLPYVFLVNAQLPDASEGVMSSWWGGGSSVAGVSLIATFRIKPETVKLANGTGKKPPALALLERFVQRGKSDKQLPFKAIGMVDNIDALDVPNIVKQYNGKPALITKSGSVFSGDIGTLPGYRYMEVDFDTRKWSVLARTSMKNFKDRTKDLQLRMAYVIEAEKDADMPEQIIGSAVVNFLDAEKDAQYVPGIGRASSKASKK